VGNNLTNERKLWNKEYTHDKSISLRHVVTSRILLIEVKLFVSIRCAAIHDRHDHRRNNECE
jgi:hypothetical protein